MGYFNVVQPCVVNGLHYIRPTVQPIEVDDDTAAPLVESGALESYAPGSFVISRSDLEGSALGEALDSAGDADVFVAVHGEDPQPVEVIESVDDEPKPRPRSRRKSDPDDAA